MLRVNLVKNNLEPCPKPNPPLIILTWLAHVVILLMARGEDNLVTVVGNLMGVVAGEVIELTGLWQRYHQHGWQFKIERYRSILPATAQGIRNYLDSGLIWVQPLVSALHLLQISLVYANTLMIQEVLAEKDWLARMQAQDLRAQTPLIYLHINPYGNFRLDFSQHVG